MVAQIRKMELVVPQSAADVSTVAYKETGAYVKDFTAIVPAYIEVQAGQVSMLAGLEPASYKFTISGEDSGIALMWGFIVKVGGALVPTTERWYRPAIHPVMFDERMVCTVASTGSGQINTGKFIMYYEIQKYTELEMVQIMAGYA